MICMALDEQKLLLDKLSRSAGVSERKAFPTNCREVAVKQKNKTLRQIAGRWQKNDKENDDPV